jgi:hypothetical protein
MAVSEILPKYGFDSSDIDRIRRLIQNSFNNLRETLTDDILHDARYDYLGRVDYILLTDKLLKKKLNMV